MKDHRLNSANQISARKFTLITQKYGYLNLTGQASQENHVERASRTSKYNNLPKTNLIYLNLNNQENIPRKEKKKSIRTTVEMD